jgi:hypothetical protein
VNIRVDRGFLEDAPDDGKHAVLDGGGKDFHFNSTYRVISEWCLNHQRDDT